MALPEVIPRKNRPVEQMSKEGKLQFVRKKKLGLQFSSKVKLLFIGVQHCALWHDLVYVELVCIITDCAVLQHVC